MKLTLDKLALLSHEATDLDLGAPCLAREI